MSLRRVSIVVVRGTRSRSLLLNGSVRTGSVMAEKKPVTPTVTEFVTEFVTAFTPAVQPPMPGEKCQLCGHRKSRKEES